MSEWLNRLKERIDSMNQKEIDEEWEKLKQYNDVGPTCEEYFEYLESIGKLNKNGNIKS